MASTGPWDGSGSSSEHQPARQPPPRRSTLRVSHLGTSGRSFRPVSPTSTRRRTNRMMSGTGVHVVDKVDDLAASLQATSEVLSTADRMLEHYRDINVEQDEEIVKLRGELEKSADLLRRERILRRRRLPATPSSSMSEDESRSRRSRGRGSVRFSEDVRSDVEDLKHAMREIKSEQNRLSGEIDSEKDERYDSRKTPSRHGSSRLPEEALLERERLLRELRETEDASRRQAEVLVRGLDAERDVLMESQRIANVREGELETLRNQLQAAQKSQQDEIEKRLREIQLEMRAEREMWERKQQEVGDLTSELRNVKSLLDNASDKKIKEEIRSVASELEAERRALEETNYEKRILSARVDDLASRLEQSERERRQVLAELDEAAKKLDQTEGGKTVLSHQAEETRQRLNRAESEKKELAQQLEEFQAKLQDNEAQRKRLQSRLDALGREVNEGHSDRERLLEQLDVLRNQLSKAELEKEDIVKQVSMATRGSSSRRQSLGPVRVPRRSGSGDVNELRQTIDQIERDLSTSRGGYDGRRGFSRGGEFDKSGFGETLENLRDDMDRKDEQQERLIEQMKDLLDKYDHSESEKRQFAKELENVNKNFKVSNVELEKVTQELENKENLLKDSEKKRNELKAKALNSLKDYRAKCKRLERDAEQGKEAMARNEKLERELRDLRTMANSSSVGGPSFSTSRRDLDDLMDQRQRLNDELAAKNTEIRELQAVRYNNERDMSELKTQLEKLTAELRAHQAQASVADMEKSKLAEALQAAQFERKQEAANFEKKQVEQQSDLEALVIEQKKEIKDLKTKSARLLNKVEQEIVERQAIEDQFLQLREQERRIRDENASVFAQLQQEREEHTMALRSLQDQIQSLAGSHEKAIQESKNQHSMEKSQLENQLEDMKLQLADEKSTIKALRNRQEKENEEIKRLTSELNSAIEDNTKLQKKFEQAREDNETAKEKLGMNHSRVTQLEDSLRRSQYSLEKAAEEQQSWWQKVDDQLDKIVDFICKASDVPLPTLLASGGIRHDSHQGVAEMIGKLRWLNEELKVRISSERRLREQVDHNNRRIMDLVHKAEEDRKYFVSELDQQSLLIDQMASQKKGLENKHRQSADDAKALKDRVRQLSKHLQNSTRALHVTTEALDDKQKVIDEIDDLKGEKQERDKIHDSYVRYKEKVGSIRKELEGVRSIAEDYKQESIDASNMSIRLTESLDRLTSPKPKQRRLHFPETPSRLRSGFKSTYSTNELSPASSESTLSMLSQEYSPPSLKSDRKRTMRSSRTPASMRYTDLDYKERPSWADGASPYEEAERDKP